MQKNKLKNILVCFMLILSAFIFSACASVNTLTRKNADGTIDELVYVKIDDATLIEQGYNRTQIVDIKNYVKNLGQSVEQSICVEFEQRLQDDLLSTDSAEEIKNLMAYSRGLQAIKVTTENDTIIFGIRFKNADVYRYYYEIPQDSRPAYQTEKHFLYTKYYYYATTSYADHQSLYNKIKNEIRVQYPQIVTNNKAELQFTYVTDLRREHSNADYVSYSNNEYYHTWIVDENNLYAPVMIYYNIANSAHCILLCISVSLIVCVVLWLIVGIKKVSAKTKNN